MRKNWTEQEKREVVITIKSKMKAGQSTRQAIDDVARNMGVSYSSINSLFYKSDLSQESVPVEPSRYHVYKNDVTFDGDALVLCDLHIPYHNAEAVNRFIGRAKAEGVTRAVLAGDVADMHALSHWPDTFQPAKKPIDQGLYDRLFEIAQSMPEGKERSSILETLEDSDMPEDLQSEIKATRSVIASLVANFDEIIVCMGNHDAWLIQKLTKSLGTGDLAALFYGNNQKVKISPFFWLEFTSGGEKWRVTHPHNAGKGSSKKLSPKFDCNIIQAHNHHFSVQSAPNGKFIAIEPGMCCDESRMSYVMSRDNAADHHVTGAVIIKAGKAILINDWM